jgi:hypothetical protein
MTASSVLPVHADAMMSCRATAALLGTSPSPVIPVTARALVAGVRELAPF